MFDKLIGKHRFKKYKWQLAPEHDITLEQLHNILLINKANFAEWRYQPLTQGTQSLDMYHTDVSVLDKYLVEYIKELLNGRHVSNDTTRVKLTIKLDDWLTDSHNVPVSWSKYYAHLIDLLEMAIKAFADIPEKKRVYFHRNALMLRDDLKTLIRVIARFQG